MESFLVCRNLRCCMVFDLSENGVSSFARSNRY